MKKLFKSTVSFFTVLMAITVALSSMSLFSACSTEQPTEEDMTVDKLYHILDPDYKIVDGKVRVSFDYKYGHRTIVIPDLDYFAAPDSMTTIHNDIYCAILPFSTSGLINVRYYPDNIFGPDMTHAVLMQQKDVLAFCYYEPTYKRVFYVALFGDETLDTYVKDRVREATDEESFTVLQGTQRAFLENYKREMHPVMYDYMMQEMDYMFGDESENLQTVSVAAP